ncbi:hypothetical protein OHC33_004865 [Knufia fluminis]|uniref:Uncharacterized protein n=1 Tax=Knufia fluminis TaxID=191047 RepID=A0AAN8INL1_9EURO|nr:hypothetical protein OHC33_004865 [Knufia fluminis]
MAALYKTYRAGNQSSRLWFYEERAGRPLVHVKSSEGVVVPDFPRREQPEEEAEIERLAETIRLLSTRNF